MLINPRIWNNRVKKIESNVDNCPGFSERRYQMICQIQKYLKEGCSYREIARRMRIGRNTIAKLLMLSWAVMISLCHADMRLPGYLSWNVSFDGADLSAPSRKELVHTSMLCQHFKRRYDGTGICLFHSAVMPEAFLIPEEICQ